MRTALLPSPKQTFHHAFQARNGGEKIKSGCRFTQVEETVKTTTSSTGGAESRAVQVLARLNPAFEKHYSTTPPRPPARLPVSVDGRTGTVNLATDLHADGKKGILYAGQR